MREALRAKEHGFFAASGGAFSGEECGDCGGQIKGIQDRGGPRKENTGREGVRWGRVEVV